MTTALEIRPGGEIAQLHQFNREQIDLLKRTVCNGSTDDEFKLFLHVAQKSGLDPFARQIHAVKRWDSKARRETMVIQTGIDGYRLIADRTGDYVGQDDAEFGEIIDDDGTMAPQSATVTVYKWVHGEARAFTKTAWWDEYAQRTKEGKLTAMWRDRPRGQLSKCAESLALRAAFPADLSGLYTHEEMQQADNGTMETPSMRVEGDMNQKQRTQFAQRLNDLRDTHGAELVERVCRERNEMDVAAVADGVTDLETAKAVYDDLFKHIEITAEREGKDLDANASVAGFEADLDAQEAATA